MSVEKHGKFLFVFFLDNPDFHHCAMNKAVQIRDKVGRITEVVEGGAKFVLMEFSSGKKKTFVTEYIVKNFSH